ncbi:UDP-N-acetylmuramoyl-L-alanyl-D-glutamate--2,6-diaminopimelate ligase [Enterobacteriaceae endosymbiont of Neohaemonia nigricornis]|uniref:UDP-N-acetylmuramoyl-L-alanyl-D-glutamate--2, 6-diaminopimelate ligase n=1 Tax=Enterobacteriaceae endosymbiont of Neohaemonia nigricornis TaxID=2675792 RepID=UPI001AC00914|nr:UDP-N-acetylmuramoyl-L-alanyl-D-glutamate--2,6-diaminopimelate ligase [Enterobacteriaceae endosymbiont of Neohaemonia nigricornis]
MNQNKISLAYLLKNHIQNAILEKIFIQNISTNSKQIKPNWLFIALKGYICNGRNFINEAISNGASAILTYNNTNNTNYIFYNNHIPIIYIKKLKYYLSSIAGLFYKHPSKEIPVIGITGTNGKTSVTNFLMQWLYLLNQKPAICSTLGNGFYNNLIESHNTTESAIEIQAKLRNFINHHSNIVILEVSSHGIHQYRISDINFNTGIFTNLTRDHLDYHKNMNNYINTKWCFFSKHIVHNKIINIDDPIGFKWYKILSNAIAVTTKKHMIYKEKLFFIVKKIIYTLNKTIIIFQSTWGSGILHLNLFGYFNVINIILSLTTLLSLKYPLLKLINTASLLKPVYGRFNILNYKNLPKIIIDYAHTPDALKNILQTIKQYYTTKKIWCIFGCGGDRDKSKRPIMGCIASNYADYIIITTDNPRNENIQYINQDILKGCNTKHNIHIIVDRFQAIYYAILHANIQDIILISGKGHEKYQIIGNNILNISDYDIVDNISKKIQTDAN